MTAGLIGPAAGLKRDSRSADFLAAQNPDIRKGYPGELLGDFVFTSVNERKLMAYYLQ